MSTLDIRDIMDMLPHRYPFLLIDRIVELDTEAGRVVALKNVTANEPQFTGHFPGVPVMPGVLIIEAMAQACAIIALSRLPEGTASICARVVGRIRAISRNDLSLNTI